MGFEDVGPSQNSRFLFKKKQKNKKNKQTLWPLFMDGVQLRQG